MFGFAQTTHRERAVLVVGDAGRQELQCACDSEGAPVHGVFGIAAVAVIQDFVVGIQCAVAVVVDKEQVTGGPVVAACLAITTGADGDRLVFQNCLLPCVVNGLQHVASVSRDALVGHQILHAVDAHRKRDAANGERAE